MYLNSFKKKHKNYIDKNILCFQNLIYRLTSSFRELLLIYLLKLFYFSLTFDLTERHSIWSVSIGATFYWIGNIAVNQSMMQRFLALSELKSAKR